MHITKKDEHEEIISMVLIFRIHSKSKTFLLLSFHNQSWSQTERERYFPAIVYNCIIEIYIKEHLSKPSQKKPLSVSQYGLFEA